MDPLVPFIYNFDVTYFGGNITLNFFGFSTQKHLFNICLVLFLFSLAFVPNLGAWSSLTPNVNNDFINF